MASQTFSDFIRNNYSQSGALSPQDWVDAADEFKNNPAPKLMSLKDFIMNLGPYVSELAMKMETPAWSTRNPTNSSSAIDELGSWNALPNPNLWSYLNNLSLQEITALSLWSRDTQELLLNENSFNTPGISVLRHQTLDSHAQKPEYQEKLSLFTKGFRANNRGENEDMFTSAAPNVMPKEMIAEVNLGLPALDDDDEEFMDDEEFEPDNNANVDVNF